MIAIFLGALVAGSIVLRPEASISGPSIEIAEVAEIRGVDAELARRIGAITLGASPSPGGIRGLRRDELGLALRAAGLEAGLSGATLCRAKPRIETVAGAGLEDAARQAVAAAFAGRDVEIEVVRASPDLSVIAAESRRDLVADVAGLARREPQPGPWSVPVDVVVDGTRVQTAWIALDVKLFESQPVAARDLRRGEAVESGTWSLQRVRVGPAEPRGATPAALMGATCTRDLLAGARITELDVRRDPLVRTGDMVELEVVRGSIRARSRAVARGTAALGDRVEVQTGEGQRRLVGTVIQRGLVRVELAAAPRNQR